ncbi:MAG: peroxidase-related enzyme [Pseudomonadales bacterium]|nr:peroxidase-related enzyme [Pseudomonadales bacterium]
MTQPDYVHALNLPVPDELDPGMVKYFNICRDKLGLVPNVLQAYNFNQDKLKVFVAFYNDLMLADSGLSKLEREMIAVVVSSINRCFYCIIAHGAALRELSGDPVLGECLVVNYRVGELSERHRAMLDFAVKETERAHEIEESDRQQLRDVGFSDPDIWDIAAVVAFFNMTNRMASSIDMMPNMEYHSQNR